ncbi:ArsR/SmtB family transcription factor [Nocardioides speluncae]|uniref:ArsR/SmtB family transcription factor n=1 Tax=Nocardioides speluncae TaxID=2670337 RepID=UPI000D6931BA|nr:metalloregulator ArsR/SmtB family transcription factor [Nocardioides speluncae]
MGVKELPVLSPSDQATPCCTPLVTTLLPEPEAQILSERFAALGDPVRLRLVSLLANAEGGAICVCDLTAPVNRSQGTVSHHLKVLSKAGLVTSEKRGRNMWYSVAPSALEALRAALVTR